MRTQWQKRVKLFQFSYAFLQNKNDTLKMVENALLHFDFSDEWLKAAEYVIAECDQIINLIKPFLNTNWSWERLSLVDRSLLIAAYAESIIIKTPKDVLIDQTIITAKNFGDAISFQYINAILDRLIK
ncbi:transcription antitermination protein NusB [Ureaplasma diversum]|uniref:Transcription termination factor n=1 Tax=Ureaplasma diversum NCTC 246 TaxID=1188241 RepID=A0A084F1L0_9BACT|nr:transcription antitermination protein NusB [Ureaplasma diversum]KEZ24102.1 Transcription termination factor [Ureaplasma diversum NCTC 246]